MKTPFRRRLIQLGYTVTVIGVTIFGFQGRDSAQSPPALIQDSVQSHAFFERGLRQLKNRNYEKAIEEFNQAIQFDPNFKEAYSGRGFAQLQSGQVSQALLSYQHILKIDPEAASAYSGLALIHTRLGDYDQSQSQTSRSASMLAKQTTRQLYQSELNLLELAEATAGRTPESRLWKLIDQGYEKLNAQNYQGAVTTFSEAAKLVPGGAVRPYIDRGVAYFWLQDYRAAIADFSTTIRANPFYIKAYDYRARAYQQIGRSREAQADFKKAIELARQFGNQALYQELIGRSQQARQ
jgi:Tfp pilus assembly protein PilF